MSQEENKVQLTKEEAQSKIDSLVADAYTSINEAESLANEHGISFGFEVSYGMGGMFYPGSEVEERSWMRDEYCLDENGGWVASSQTC